MPPPLPSPPPFARPRLLPSVSALALSAPSSTPWLRGSSGLGVRTRELFIRRSLSDDITTVLALNHNVRPVTSRCVIRPRARTPPCQRVAPPRSSLARVLLVFVLLKSANNYSPGRNVPVVKVFARGYKTKRSGQSDLVSRSFFERETVKSVHACRIREMFR